MTEILNSFSTESEKNDNAFKLAMFNGIAILLVILAIVTICGVYFILQPFIKPLLWALLCGSALHPFKLAIATRLRTQVVQLESSPKPFYLNVLCLPFLFILKLSDALGDFLISHLGLIIKFVGTVSALSVMYFYTPQFVWKLCSIFMGFNKYMINFTLDIFNSSLITITVIAGFIGALMFLWKPEHEFIFSLSSIFVWITTTSWVANCFSYLRIPVFVLFQFSLCGGYVYTVACKSSASIESSPCASAREKQEEVFTFTQSNPESQQTVTSMTYIRWLFVICIGALLFSIPSFPYIFLMMLTIYGIKQLCIYFGLVAIVNSHMEVLFANSYKWYLERQDIILPKPLKFTVIMLTKVRDNFFEGLKNCCDSAAAVAVILGLLIFGTFISVFFTIQAYKEGMYLVQTGGNIINSTIVHNPELHQMLPEDWQTTMDNALNDAYIYARDALTKLVRKLVADKGISEDKRAEIEKGALELWDRAYQAWVMPTQTTIGPTVTPDAVLTSCQKFIERIKKTPGVINWPSIRSFVQENMSTLSTGFDSVWLILKGNMSLLLGILSTVFSLVFGGGLSVINFTLHSVVFLTALFYLLSTSRDLYKPVEMVTQMSPKYGSKLALAVEHSCQEVLAASAKLSIFYGLWTWLIHTIFQSNIVYMPAVFASVLGVVPMLGTYWACLPAILDLWLMQDSKLRAIGLFLAQIFPTAVVETTVYNEIKGGHPYLTGLSVAGGIFWLGIEGAIAGPLILCFLFTIINMVSNNDNPDASSP
uniref:Putative conserved plasma membrane protein n=2 Tax=Panstrongylus TaxID=65342 RepID=A0A069DZI5_9HEMI